MLIRGEKMLIERQWAMPNKNTFSIKPIHDLLSCEVEQNKIVVDPFSNGEREFGTLTNDLNPNVDSDYHKDALQFLKSIPTENADIVLYDPPYSTTHRTLLGRFQKVIIILVLKLLKQIRKLLGVENTWTKLLEY